MPTALPPINQDTWDQHVETTSQERVASDLASIDQARAAQQQAEAHRVANDARDEQDAQQRARSQIEAIGIAQSRNQEEVATQQRVAAQIDAIRAPAMPRQQAMSPNATSMSPDVTSASPDGTSMSPDGTSVGPTDVGGTDWRAYAAQAAQRAGIDPALFQRQIQQESGFDPTARSGAGAQGIAQIVPSAHPGVNPLDPKASLDYAANWMRSLVDRYGGDARKALAAYNAGPGAVDKYGGVPPFEETQRYVRTIYDEGGQASPLEPPTTPGAQSSQYATARAPGRVEAVGQFEQGLPYEEAVAICGPVAALAFAKANGRNPDLAEVRALAKGRGWTSTGGMNGIANEQATLTDLGVKSRLDTNPDFGHIAQDAASGNPVIISTPVHYYYANNYDPATGKIFVGKTGTSRKGGGSWMTPQEIATLDGGINGALFVDNPQSPAPSVGASQPDDGVTDAGDRPPSEFEAPSQFQGDRYLGRRPDQPITMGDVGQPTIAAGLPRTPLEAARTEATAIGNQIADTARYRQETDDLTLKDIASRRGGPPLTPDEQEQLRQANLDLAMSLTPEPLARAGGQVAGRLGRAALEATGAGKAVEGIVDVAGRPIRAAAGEVAPILDRLGNVLKEATVRLPKEAITHPEFLQPEAALPARTVSLVRQGYDRVRNVLGSMGEAGQDLAGRIHAGREGAETDAAAYLDRMPGVKQLGRSDFVNMVDVLEGNATPKSAQVERAAGEVKGVLDDLFSRATNAGVDVAERIDNYFPHVYKDATIRARLDTARRGELIRRVMDEQNLPEGEATAVVHRWIQGGERDRRQGSLEMARLANLPGYEKTKEALFNHVLTASKRINEVAQFGREDAIANRLIDRMGAEGYPVALARDLFQTAVGAHTYPEQIQRLSRIARAYHTITRLGWAVLGNATQPVNTASVAGVVRTMAASAKAAFNPAERRFADLTGSTLDSVIKEVREGGGWSDRVTGKAMLGFGEVEKWNRRLTAIAGRDFARDMASRAAGTATGLNRIGTQGGARRALERMGLDADAIVRRGGTLTSDEEIAAARSMVERTQFRTDPQDIPEWASHPLGRMVFQFKAFPYSQTAFIKRDLIDEARKGNVAPIVRFAILAPLAQAAATEARNAVQGRDPEEDPGMRAVQYALGPLGLVGDVSRTVFGINSKYVPAERRASQLVGSMLGPTAGTLTEAAVAGLNASDILFHPDESKVEQRLTPGLRMALRQIPYVGGLAANKITPYKSQQGAPPAPAAPSRSRDGSRTTRERSRSGGR